MSDFKTLRLLDSLRPLFTKFGVNYPMMRLILQTKLTMDERRVPTLFNQQAVKKKDPKYGYVKSLWIYTVMSIVLIPLMAFSDNYIFQLSISYALIIFLIMSSMISEFSTVLLDLRDRNILATKPISMKTRNAAKITHITIYLTYLTISLMILPLIISLFTKGILFVLLTIVTLLFINILVVVLTAVLYTAILRFFDGEKLKDFINYVQIGLAVAMMVGYQLLVRMFAFVDLNVVVDFKWWSIFLLPMWFAAPYEVIFSKQFTFYPILLTILAILIPIIAITYYIRLAPVFESNLQKLTAMSQSKKQKQNRLRERLLNILCPTIEEQGFYRFTQLMMKNEREFKFKVYPSLGFSFVIPFIFMLNNLSSGSVNYATSYGYFTVYFCLLVVPTAVLMLGHSTKYKAAWIYKAAPLNHYIVLQKASLKAVIIRLFLPLFVALSTALSFIYGIRILPNLFAVFISSCIYIVLCYVAFGRTLPFSKPHDIIGQTDSWKAFVLFIPIAVIGFTHFIMSAFVPFGTWIYLMVGLFVNWIIWTFAFHR